VLQMNKVTRKVVCFVAAAVLLASPLLPVFGQVPDWFSNLLRIRAGASTMADVERSFPEARIESEFISRGIRSVYYTTQDGKLSVKYTNVQCIVSQPERLEIGKGKVLDAFFSIRRGAALADLGYSKDSMYRYFEDDNPTEHFMDKTKGIDFSLQRNKITSITIFLPALWHQIAEQSRSSKTPDPYASLVCED
jgi:hypothetical protein